MAPIASPPPMHLWAKPYWSLGQTRAACNRVSPVGKREARRKWAFVCFLLHNQPGGRKSTGEGAAAASVPCPSSCLPRAGRNSTPFASFSLVSNCPAPTSAPQTCLLLSKEGPGMTGTCLPTSAPIQNKEQFPRGMRTQMITKEEENQWV